MSNRSWAWRTARNHRLTTARTNDEPCTRCGQPIDYTLTGRHRWGPTIDHLNPLTLGGDEVPPPELLAPAHRHCNTSHGAQLGNRLRGQRRTAVKPIEAQLPQGAPAVPPSLETLPTEARGPRKGHPAVSSHRDSAPEPHRGPEPSPRAITAPGTPPIAADLAALPWLAPLFPIPPTATWPRFITAPHPAAAGSYGVAGIEWIHQRRAADPRVPARAKRLRWWQQLVLLRQWEHDAAGQLVWPESLLTVSRQVGKDLDCSTAMLTWNRGWTTMGDLRAGDSVFAPDGSPTRVVVAHPAAMAPFGAFRVTLTDGRSLVAGGRHLWEVFDHHGAGARRVMTTAQLVDAGLSRDRETTLGGKVYASREYRFRLSDQAGVVLPPQRLPLDPWMLGYWLGNGTSAGAEVTVGLPDEAHVVAMVAAVGAHVLSATRGERATRVGFSTSPTRARRLRNDPAGGVVMQESGLSVLRGLGVLGDKHIPELYLLGSADQRLALLRGLMDSDGYAPRRGCLELCFTNERLAMDAATLIRSLGYQPRWSESEARIGGRYVSQRWRIRFSVPRGMPVPFTLPRKAARVVETGWRKRPSVASIVRVPDRWMRCITVDRPDGMFLAGRELVPTHNSTSLAERSMARTVLFPAWAGEPQLVMQVSKDLAAAREVQRLLRMWAAEQDGMKVRGTHGQEEIELGDGSRYMIRGRDSVYSYSVSAAELDEAWGVRPDVVDDGIEPTMAERELSQLSLTSTAHPRATPLFPTRRAAALRELHAPVRNTPLLVEWSAGPELDADDVAAWRAASPHWDQRRADVLERAHRRWREGRQDDELVAAGGFEFQWLNRWPGRSERPSGRLDPAVWGSAARPGVVPVPARRVVAVGHDRVSGAWVVAWAGRDADGVVVAGGVATHGGLDAARADAEAVVAGGGGVLLLPSMLRGYVRVRGCRGGPVLLRESDVASSWEILEWRLGAGAVLHPGDRAMTAAVLGVPVSRRPGVWDAGVLLVCALWWAGRDDAPRTAVV